MIEKIENIYLGTNAPPTILECTEGDTMWRWHFRIYFESQRWTIPSGSVVMFTGKKSDGNVFDLLQSVEDNEAVVTCDEQMTAAVGPTPCVLRIIDANGKTVASAPIMLAVKPNPQTMGTMSETVLSAYNDALQAIAEGVAYQKSIIDAAVEAADKIPADLPGLVTDWLDNHVDPETGYVIDDSLTVAGAAADSKAAGIAVGALKSAIVQLTEGECTIDGWEMGSLSVSTGEPYDSDTQIRTTKKIGVSTGAGKIVTSGEPLYVLAWDLEGTYIGFYNSDKKFSKVTAKYATWKEFDCTIYPDYLFKFVTNTKRGVTIEEGKNVKFIPLIVNSINDMPSQIESVNSFRKVTSDDIESGSWSYSTKTANSKRIRSKFLYPVRNGMDVYFTSPTLDLYIGVLTKPDDISVAESNGWSAAKSAEQVYHISHDGYAYIILRKPGDSTDISVSDFDADIKIFNEQAYYDLINEGNRDLYKIFQRVGVIGDSISVGYIDSNYPIRNLIYSWPKKIMQDAGVPWLNFGYPGFTTLTWCSDLTYGKVQMEAENNKCQAYLICLGCNDEWNTFRHVELGSQSDVVDDPDVVATTYYGGYNRIIQLLKRRNPYCKIFCVTNPVATESLGYNNAVRWIATSHYSTNDGVFLLELAWKYRRIINDDAFGIKPDRVGVHYYPFGYRMIGTLMEKALNEIIRDNRSYFSNIAAVPYDTGTPTADTMV